MFLKTTIHAKHIGLRLISNTPLLAKTAYAGQFHSFINSGVPLLGLLPLNVFLLNYKSCFEALLNP